MILGASATPTTICLLIRREDELDFFEVDLLAAPDIATTYAITDIFKLSAAANPFSKQVQLLGTPQTNKALQYVFRVDKITNKILHKRITARLLIDGIDILVGGGILEVTEMVNNQVRGTIIYQCDLTGANYNWSVIFKDLEWCDIPLGSHVFDEDNVRDSWDRLGKLGTPFDYSFIGASYYPVHYGWWRQKTRVSIYDLRPHVYLKWLLEVAFTFAGYTLIGDYSISDEFEGLSLPFTRGVFGVSDTELQRTNKEFIPIGGPYDPLNVTSNVLDSTVALDDYWYFKAWTQPFNAYMRVRFELNDGDLVPAIPFPASNVSYTQPVIWAVFVNGVNVGQENYPNTVTPGDPMVLEVDIPLEAGDIVQIQVLEDPLATPPPAAQILIPPGEGVFNFIPLTGILLGDTVDLCDTLDSAISITDVIKGFIHERGLYMLTNEENKTVEFIKISDFYTTDTHEDWTPKVNCDADITEIVLEECRNYVLKFKQDNDIQLFDQNCIEFEKGFRFSQLVIHEPEDACRTTFENPIFSATNSVGHMPRANLIHGLAKLYSVVGLTFIMEMDNPNGHYQWVGGGTIWQADRVGWHYFQLTIADLLVSDYHLWQLEVNGVPTATAEYIGVGFNFEWYGCLQVGDQVRYRIIQGPNAPPPPDGAVTITLGKAALNVKWGYWQFHDIDLDGWKSIMPSLMKNTPVPEQAEEKDPLEIISHDLNPRLIKFEGLLDATDLGWIGGAGTLIRWRFNNDTVTTVEGLLPFAYQVDYYQNTRDPLIYNDFSINPNSPDIGGTGNVIVPNPVIKPGTHTTDYKFLTDLLSRGMRFDVWVNLRNSDIKSLNFNLPKILHLQGFSGGVFVLNKVVDWRLDTQEAKLEMLLLLNN